MNRKFAKVIALVSAASMILCSTITGTAATSNQTSEREEKNAQLSLEAATEGMVLLENEDAALPLAAGSKIALFGSGSYTTIKGGTGSGDVNQRYTVSIYDALTSTFQVTNLSWWDSYVTELEVKKAECLAQEADNDYLKFIKGSFGADNSVIAKDVAVSQEDIDAAAKDASVAVYTISRTSGEGADREIAKGDYYLSDIERANIEAMAKAFDKSIVLLNVGGVVDTKFYDEIPELDALVLVSQGGMEIGTAVAELLSGEVNPSGKLSDTWAENYSDYPASATIANADENALQEDYTEGIYVGYRYFDTFNVTPAYEFGYGKSYTDFSIEPVKVTADADQVSVQVKVTNTGSTYSGKEVVEVYFSAPAGDIEKPYQEMAAFGKTDLLAPGESQLVTVSYKTTEMSSYSEAKAAYIMEDGDYIVRVGNSSRNTKVAAVLNLDKDVITEQLSNQLTADKELDLLSNANATPYSYDTEAAEIASAAKIALDSSSFVTENNASTIDETAVTTYLTADAAATYTAAANETVVTVDAVPEGTKLIDVYNGTVSMESFVASLTDSQLANIANGITGATTEEEMTDWGADANSVAGAAGETTQLYGGTLGIPNTVEADGPAGIRVTQASTSDDGTTTYNYCTAFPIGTMLAQTWNTDLVKRVGEAIGEEMSEIGVTLWLAPGMNIHRDPLCGRNFEYYSEDPALTGYTGSAITAGVQSNPGVGVTIKHYITNNQETSRNQVNTTVSERTLREIYLKGFEMVVKSAQPMAIMSSYNKVNGTYACENFDLLTSIPRGEWGFDGMVMTDWGAGNRAGVQGMMHAGNDLVMPGRTQQRMIDALAGTPSNDLDTVLLRGDVQKCVSNVLTMIMRSSQFGKMYPSVNVEAHTETYSNLVTYSTVSKGSVKTAEVNSLEQRIAEKEKEIEELKAKAEKLEADLGAQSQKVQEVNTAIERLTFSTKIVKMKSLKSSKTTTAVAKWKKVAGADGYVVQYSKKSTFASVTRRKVGSGTTLSKTLSGLTKGKTIYVRVRAYKTIDGKKVYTEFSNPMKVKVK